MAVMTGSGPLLSSNDSFDRITGTSSKDPVPHTSSTAGVTVSPAVTVAQATGRSGSDEWIGIANIQGGSFNDIRQGKASSNIINGNGGIDTMLCANATGEVRIDLSTSLMQNTISAGMDPVLSMKSLIGCGSHQLLVVSSIGNSIRGGGSSDTILCSTRNDFLEDGAGKDILGGKGRNDAFAFTSLRDSLAAILDITSDCSVGDRLDRLGVFSPPLSLTSASLFASFTAIPKPFAATSSAGIQAHHWPYWYLHRVQ